MKHIVGAATFAAALVVGAAQSFATSVTISFSGTVDGLYDPGDVSGYTSNGPFSGTATIDFSDTPLAVDSGSFHDTRFIGTGPFGVGSNTAPGAWQIETQNNGTLGYFGITFTADDQVDSGGHSFSPGWLLIDFTADNPNVSPITTLLSLPHDKAGILSYLGGTLLSANTGMLTNLDATHELFDLTFNLDSLTISVASPVAQTPVPATLPLLVSALAGLGFAARRRTR